MHIWPRISGIHLFKGSELRRSLLVLIAVETLIVFLAWQGSTFWFEEAVDDVVIEVKQDNQNKLQQMMQFVTGSYIPTGGIPQVLAFDTVLRAATRSQPGDKAREDANTLLEYFADKLGVDVIWLLDSSGTCIAASNSKQPESFVGTDYSDRKYYLDPKRGILGRQFAVGRKTKVPGLFFSAPVTIDGQFSGVVAIKTNLPQLAGKLMQPGTFISDSQGVVILSQDPTLSFQTVPDAAIQQLSSETIRRQYSKDKLEAISVVSAGLATHPDIIRLGGSPTPSVLTSLDVLNEGLRLFAMTETPQISSLQSDRRTLFAFIVVVGLLLGWASVGLLAWRKHYEGKLSRAEKDVAALKSSYELILRSAGDGIIGIGPDEIITFANPAACAMLKTERHILEGSPYRTALCGAYGHLPAFPLPNGASDTREHWFMRSDKTPFTAEYILAPMEHNGVFEGATLVFRDISLRKQYEENISNHQHVLERQVAERTQTILEEVRLRTLTEEAMKKAQTQAMQASKLASVGQLAAGIAHEINTPVQYVGDNLRFIGESLNSILHAIKLAEELLIEADSECAERFAKEVDKENFEYLRADIVTAVKESLDGVTQIGRIVLSMKEFSHPGSNAKTMVDINRSLENTLTVSRNVWKHVAEIDRHFDPDLPLVLCHAGEMNQVFLNLIVNASQAIEEAGKPFPGHIVITTSHDQSTVTISVSDSGTGVPDSIREKIFDPFFTTKDVGKGTGQGLAICYDVVVGKHQGTLDVGGKSGEGAIFNVHLPIGCEDQEVSAAE